MDLYAREGGRTPTSFRTLDPESSASANSATLAGNLEISEKPESGQWDKEKAPGVSGRLKGGLGLWGTGYLNGDRLFEANLGNDRQAMAVIHFGEVAPQLVIQHGIFKVRFVIEMRRLNQG